MVDYSRWPHFRLRLDGKRWHSIEHSPDGTLFTERLSLWRRLRGHEPEQLLVSGKDREFWVRAAQSGTVRKR